MNIRLMGTPGECTAVADKLATVFHVVEISDPRANRGDSELVRVYVEIRLDAPADP